MPARQDYGALAAIDQELPSDLDPILNATNKQYKLLSEYYLLLHYLKRNTLSALPAGNTVLSASRCMLSMTDTRILIDIC